MYKITSLAIVLTLFFNSNAQSIRTSLAYGTEATKIASNTNVVRIKHITSIPNYIQFQEGKALPLNKLESWLQQFYKSDDNFGLKLLTVEEDQLGFTHYRYQQTINTIPVRLSMYNVHTKNGLIYSMNGELFDNLGTATQVGISEANALNKALNYIGATTYMWEAAEAETHLKWEQNDPAATYYPKGNLVYINEKGDIAASLKLTYVFNIYALEPFNRKEIYIDAQSGNVVWEEQKIHDIDVTGTAATGYSGTKPITSDNFSGTQHRLRESGRGNGIRTFNNQNTTTYSNTDFVNNTANWTTFNPTIDQFATDAHYAAEVTYDYFFTQHNRNSIDNNGFQLNSYVHHDNNFFNAFWDGQRMSYGDGNNNASPLTSVDIGGHEIGHGLTTFTANLIYQAESGALNESFSDVFGNSIEIFARPTQNNWQLGEDLGTIIRNMQNPNAQGDPDTYFGQNWASLTGGDNGGVHTNSGVQNRWYVLLADGGSGTNDNNDPFSVTGQGIVKAGQVAYRNLVVYLTPSSGYTDARFFAIQSAADLFGGCTPEVASVTNAWHAVGVGPAFSPTTVSDFTAPITTSCQAPFTVTFNNTSVNGSTFFWDFGDGATSTQMTPTHTYSTFGTYNVKLVVDGGAACGIDSVTKNAFVVVDANAPCVVTLPPNGTTVTQTACAGKLFDSGGAIGNYGANETAQITISPLGASSVTLNFVSFDIEAGQGTSCNFDFINVYDGANTSTPLLGTYCNNNVPTSISSTASSITIEFSSDGGVENAGFEVDWLCVQSNQPPTANFTSNIDTTCTGEIQFTDISTNGPTSWLWSFGDGATSTLQHPTHQYTLSGTYNVQLNATNGIGNNMVVKNNFITVNLPAPPSVIGDAVCNNNTANLSAAGVGTLNWYNAQTGGTLVNTGSTFTTPALTATTTYYVEDVIAAPLQNVGKPNNTGSGANFNSQQHLKFDVFAPITIVDVVVYAGAAGNRTIELRSSSNAVLQSTTVNIAAGQQTVPLNFSVALGTDYQLGVAQGSTIDMFRNDGGVSYPYTINGLVSITRSSAGTGGGLNHYYFFYDWNVKAADCISAREPVTATVNTCTSINELSAQSNISSYYDAAANWLNLTTTNLPFGTYNATIVNALGQVVATQQITVNATEQQHNLKLNHSTKGMYVINLVGEKQHYTNKFVQ